MHEFRCVCVRVSEHEHMCVRACVRTEPRKFGIKVNQCYIAKIIKRNGNLMVTKGLAVEMMVAILLGSVL